jgi:putative endopeptidase
VPAPLAWVLSVLLLLGSLQGAAWSASAQSSTSTSPTDVAPGINPADLDLSVDPGDDFFQFANGGWTARTEIPAYLPSYDPFDEVAERVDDQLIGLIEDFDTDPETDEGKTRALYDQFVDTETRDAQGIEPVQRFLDMTTGIDSIEEGLAFHPTAYAYALPGLFAVGAAPLPEDASTYGALLIGPILSLPSEDYYLDDTADGQEIRDAWVETTTALLVELGYSEEEAAIAAETVLAFETELARIKTPSAELFTDPQVSNNPRTPEELEDLLPGMDWETFFDETGLPRSAETITVYDIAYMEGLQDVLDEADPLTLRYLYDVQLIWTFSSYLTTEIDALAFSFNGGTLLGLEERRPVEQRALFAVQEWIPDTLSQAYVEEYFSPETKAEVEDMIDKIVAAFRIRVENNPWMTEETKAETLEKLDLLIIGIGYPDDWFSFENVEVGDSLFETVMNIYSSTYAQGFEGVGYGAKRDRWFMNPIDVNAAYSPDTNMMIFPAAILQPPYFDPNADLATNYGGIGAIIGHELIHAFDPSGAQYDGEGNLVSWWTETDYAAFQELTDRVIDRYSELEVLPGIMLNGELSIGENVADMGAVQVAYDALQIHIALDGPEHGPWFLTQEQRFFVSWATIWRDISTPEYYEFLITTDEHAPNPIRAVEPLRHMDAFYEAFDIGPDDPEYLPPEERIVIW